MCSDTWWEPVSGFQRESVFTAKPLLCRSLPPPPWAITVLLCDVMMMKVSTVTCRSPYDRHSNAELQRQHSGLWFHAAPLHPEETSECDITVLLDCDVTISHCANTTVYSSIRKLTCATNHKAPLLSWQYRTITKFWTVTPHDVLWHHNVELQHHSIVLWQDSFPLCCLIFPRLPCHTVICWTLASQCSIDGVTSCQILTSQCSSCTWQLSVTSQNWNEELKYSIVHDKAPLHHCIVTSMHRWPLPSSVGFVFLLWRTWSWLLGFVVWVCVLFWFGLVCRNVEDFRT